MGLSVNKKNIGRTLQRGKRAVKILVFGIATKREHLSSLTLTDSHCEVLWEQLYCIQNKIAWRPAGLKTSGSLGNCS